MSEQNDQYEQVPDESEQLDQLSEDDSLIDRGVEDPLDEGYIAPDQWSAGEGYGNTAAEAEQGESLDMRLRQENPDVGPGSYGGEGTPEQEWGANNPGTGDLLEGREEADEFDDARGADSINDPEVGNQRAGRLVDAETVDGEDVESEVLGTDVGLAGGAASAEEAAMHIVDEH